MGKIPENTPNINEMTMYCSAQKQGKDVPLQDPQHTHTQMFAVPRPSVKAIQECTEGNLHTAVTSDQPGCANLGREAPAKPGSESPESFGP